MNTTKMIRWGIMGCGKIAHKFAQDLQTIPNAALQGVASRDLYKAKEFGKRYNSFSCFGSYEELASNPEIDVIYIATPHVFHYENTLLSLRHQKAVVCEKPFAMNTKQVELMIEEAKRQGVFLMEALWTYFLPHYQFTLNLVNSGTLGEIKSLEADFGFAGDPDPEGRLYNKKLGGGSLLDVGIYPLFAALTLIGFPDEIAANASFSNTGIDRNCTMKLSYKNGTKASLFSAIDQKTDTTAKIELEKGSILLHGNFHQPSSVSIRKEDQENIMEFAVRTHGYDFEAIHVMDMLHQGKKESTIMSFEKSLQLISLLDTVRERIGLRYD